MKMSGCIVILLAGLFVCGCLVYRQHQRPRATMAVTTQRPADTWPQGITLTPIENSDWREKLRREEAKQRPQEGRN